MPGRSKHWQFTLNNYTDNHERELEALAESPAVDYLIYGKEVGSSGTPHLQGHVSYSTRKVFAIVKGDLPEGAHLEVVRLLQHHIEYCKKDGSYREFGTPPHGATSKPGARSEFADFRSTVADGVHDTPELREKHPNVMARYPVFARSVIRDLFPVPPPRDHDLRDWQRYVLAKLDGEPHPRRILFVVDRAGNQGKTWFAKHVRSTREAVQIIRPSRVNDMAYQYKPTSKIVFIDIPRSKIEQFQYAFLEYLKDGILPINKYESTTLYFDPPHVVVTMNEDPDLTALSDDRYEIIQIYQGRVVPRDLSTLRLTEVNDRT